METELEYLTRKIHEMIDGIIPHNQNDIERFNELCRNRRDLASH